MLHATEQIIDVIIQVLPVAFTLVMLFDFCAYVKREQSLKSLHLEDFEEIKTIPLETVENPKPEIIIKTQTQKEETNENTERLLDITRLKLYKLHGYSVVMTRDLITIPDHVKRYRLRGKDCIRLEDLENLIG